MAKGLTYFWLRVRKFLICPFRSWFWFLRSIHYTLWGIITCWSRCFQDWSCTWWTMSRFALSIPSSIRASLSHGNSVTKYLYDGQTLFPSALLANLYSAIKVSSLAFETCYLPIQAVLWTAVKQTIQSLAYYVHNFQMCFHSQNCLMLLSNCTYMLVGSILTTMQAGNQTLSASI